MSQPDLTRAEQIADTIAILRELLGEREASRVHVEVTRGGTYKVTAEVANEATARHQFTTGRRG